MSSQTDSNDDESQQFEFTSVKERLAAWNKVATMSTGRKEPLAFRNTPEYMKRRKGQEITETDGALETSSDRPGDEVSEKCESPSSEKQSSESNDRSSSPTAKPPILLKKPTSLTLTSINKPTSDEPTGQSLSDKQTIWGEYKKPESTSQSQNSDSLQTAAVTSLPLSPLSISCRSVKSPTSLTPRTPSPKFPSLHGNSSPKRTALSINCLYPTGGSQATALSAKTDMHQLRRVLHNDQSGRDSGLGDYSSRESPELSPKSSGSDVDRTPTVTAEDTLSDGQQSPAHSPTQGVTKLQKQLRQISKQKNQLRTVVERAEEEISRLQEEKDTLHTELILARQQVEMYRSAYDNSEHRWEETHHQMSKQLQELQLALTLTHDHAKRRDVTTETLRILLTNLNLRSKPMAKPRTNTLDNTEELKGLRSQLEATHAELQQAVEDQKELGEQVSSLLEEKSQLQKELEMALEKAKQEEHDTTANLAEYRQATKDLQMRCHELEQETENEKAKVSELQERITELQAELDDARTCAGQAHTTLADAEQFHKQELAALGRALDKATRENEEAALVHNAELETERCRHSQEVAVREKQLQKLEEEVDFLTKKTRNQEKKLVTQSDLECQIMELTVGNEVLENKCKQLELEMVSLKLQVTDAQWLAEEARSTKCQEENEKKKVSSAKEEPSKADQSTFKVDPPSVKKPRPNRRDRRFRHTIAVEPFTLPAKDREEEEKTKQCHSAEISPKKSALKSSEASGQESHLKSSTSPKKSHWKTLHHTMQFTSAIKQQQGISKKQLLLDWCKERTQGYKGVEVTNFHRSWSNGLAFCALIHSYLPKRIPYETLNKTDRQRNFELAFSVAERHGVARLLDVVDMVEMDQPEWMSVMTYISSLYNCFALGRH